MSLGIYLKNARQKMRLEIHDISVKTRINKKYLQAFENEEFDALPEEVYVKGFLKNYAAELSLNPEEVVDLYIKTRYGDSIMQVKNDSYPPQPIFFRQKIDVKRNILGAVAVVSSLSLAIFFIVKMTLFSYSLPKVFTPAVPSDAIIENIISNSTVLANPSVTSLIKKPIPQMPLKFKINTIGKVWICVTIDGKVAFQGELDKGYNKNWEAKQDFTLKIGNVWGILLSLNGKEVDVKKNSVRGVNTISINRKNYKNWLK
ncbi:MAG: RodZ domain-containing protein [Elusimicrobiota bacterium]